jgi:hypothetical protein
MFWMCSCGRPHFSSITKASLTFPIFSLVSYKQTLQQKSARTCALL